MSTPKRVCIVGGGVAGLVSAKECLQAGLVPTCYEMDSDVGGTWHQKADPHSSPTPMAWDSLVTNTSKHCTTFSDFPAPISQTPYITREDMKTYLERYAKHFDITKYITLNTKVAKVCRAADFDTTGRWEVYTCPVNKLSAETVYGDTPLDQCKKEIFDAVFICSGYFRRPLYPDVTGMDKFKGHSIHSFHYKSAKDFDGKTVLVVGNSYSAIDVAEDVANCAGKVILAVGRGCWILPRINMGGIPFTETEMCSRSFLYGGDLERRSNKFLMDQCRVRLDHDKTRIRPATLPKQSPVAMGESIQIKIMTGKVQIYGYLASLDGNSATFEDSSVVDNVDSVIYCTGFQPNLGYLEENIIQEGSRLELYLMMYPLDRPHNTLAIIGHSATDASFPPFAELQARLAVKVTTGEMTLPPKEEMLDNIKMLNSEKFRKRHTYYIPGHFIKDLIAEKLGVYPNFWRILVRDPLLAFRVWYGPVYNSHYRLFGPGSNWDEASQRSHQAYEEKGMCHGPKPLAKMPETEDRLARLQKLVTWGICAAVPLCALAFKKTELMGSLSNIYRSE